MSQNIDTQTNNACATPADFGRGHGDPALSLASPALMPRTAAGSKSFIIVNIKCVLPHRGLLLLVLEQLLLPIADIVHDRAGALLTTMAG